MRQEQLAAALNEHMRRYIKDPAAFEAEFLTVTKFLRGKKKPTYGDEVAQYLYMIAHELNAKRLAAVKRKRARK